MSTPDWALELLRCPITGERLQLATNEIVAQLQGRLKAGDLLNASGNTIEDEFEAGLLNASSTYFYPIRSAIPSLMRNEAIELVVS